MLLCLLHVHDVIVVHRICSCTVIFVKTVATSQYFYSVYSYLYKHRCNMKWFINQWVIRLYHYCGNNYETFGKKNILSQLVPFQIARAHSNLFLANREILRNTHMISLKSCTFYRKRIYYIRPHSNLWKLFENCKLANSVKSNKNNAHKTKLAISSQGTVNKAQASILNWKDAFSVVDV